MNTRLRNKKKPEKSKEKSEFSTNMKHVIIIETLKNISIDIFLRSSQRAILYNYVYLIAI